MLLPPKLSLPLKIAASLTRRPSVHSYGPHPSQTAELFLPSGPGPFPVAVVLHGGYWQAQWSKLVTRPVAVDLMKRGWAAWNVEYRRLGPDGGGWPHTFDDVASAIDYLASLEDVPLDLDDVSIVGHSAGGQLALWAGARPRFDAGAPGAMPRVAVRRVVALAAVSHLRYAGRTAHVLLGGPPEECPDRWAQADPLAQLPLDVPVLLVHPSDDRTVSVKQSRAYAAAARQAGADVTLVEPETGGHRAGIDPSTPAWKSAAGWLRVRRSQASSGTSSPFMPG
ncbi:MAG TPA: alpha/beta hydrolase [Actinomycetota bacterium]|nr:alpha/beta hydrolase [Actinomycetota bacterium]